VAIPRAVTAELVERFIFNFRLQPAALKERLPVGWLEPQVINGWSVASFCILNLRNVMVAPLPGRFGYRMLSCAYRCGIIDKSNGTPTPSVYILDRNTDLPLVARLATFMFLDTIPMVRINLSHSADAVDVRVLFLDRERMFGARVHGLSSPGPLRSRVFGSLDDFATFIKGGVSSYTPSIFGDALARVDLHKEDTVYEAVEADVDYDWLGSLWQDAKLEFDCVVRATGGRYVWTYRGLRSELSRPRHAT
jgi:hypothetical protein